MVTFSFLEDAVQDLLILTIGKVLADYYISVLTQTARHCVLPTRCNCYASRKHSRPHRLYR